MSESISDEDIKAIEGRLALATPGPWVAGPWAQLARHVSEVCAAEDLVVVSGSMNAGLAKDDLDFIAHARQDVPALVAEVRRLRAAVEAERKRWQAEVEHYKAEMTRASVVAHEASMKLEDAVEAEREACAQACERVGDTPQSGPFYWTQSKLCADAIRARWRTT